MSAMTDIVTPNATKPVSIAKTAMTPTPASSMHLKLPNDRWRPMEIAFWGIPTAICAFIVHALRLYRFDLMLARDRKSVV